MPTQQIIILSALSTATESKPGTEEAASQVGALGQCTLRTIVLVTLATLHFRSHMLEAVVRTGWPLFEGNPVGEGTTRRGTDTPVHHPEKPAGSTHSSTRGL